MGRSWLVGARPDRFQTYTDREGAEKGPERVAMGQHRIQRQILRNFSFGGRQPNSRETWHLNKSSYCPTERSIRGVGVFSVDCSEDVDDYITNLENGFKDSLRRFSQGDFTKADVGREIYDFIAMRVSITTTYVPKHVVCKLHTLWANAVKPRGSPNNKLRRSYTA